MCVVQAVLRSVARRKLNELTKAVVSGLTRVIVQAAIETVHVGAVLCAVAVRLAFQPVVHARLSVVGGVVGAAVQQGPRVLGVAVRQSNPRRCLADCFSYISGNKKVESKLKEVVEVLRAE